MRHETRSQRPIATKVRTIRLYGLRHTDLDLSTRYTTNFMYAEVGVKQKATFAGNNVKLMHVSVRASLKKLRTL